MLSHRALARTVRNTWLAKTSGQSSSRSTAAMKASVTRTERLKLRKLPGSRLAAMKASISGWSHRNVAIIGAAAGAGGHDGAAHRVPYIHEGQRPRGVGADALDRSAFGPQRREVVADAAALLHRQRGFAQVTEYAAEIVLDVAHHKAVEQRRAAPSAGARQDPSRRKEAEIFEHLVERHLPSLRVILWGSQRAGDAPPAVLYRDIDRGAVVGLQPILGIPDLPRDRGDFDRDACRFRIRAEAVPGSWSGGRGSRLERRDVHIHCALLVFCVSLALGTRRRPGQGRRGGSAPASAGAGSARRTLAATGGAWHPSRPLFCDALLWRLGRVQCRSEPLQQFGGIESVDPSAHWHRRCARLVQPAGDPVPVGNVVEEQRRGGGPAAVIAI